MTDCASRLAMTHGAYEALRADPTTFAVIPGHERLEVEEVLHARETYNVVRKRDPAAVEVAVETDPRS
jgi:hypothetical protein